MSNLSVCFILVEPTTPENIGASARAIKTMGFGDLRLVNPCDHLCDKARLVAHGALDVLEGAKVHFSLETAIAGIDFVVGTSAQQRHVKHDYHWSDELLPLIQAKSETIRSIAIVFGREKCGLNNTEMNLCHIASGVPMKTTLPVLNLSHAVMIYAHLLSPLAVAKKPRRYAPVSATPGEYAVLRTVVGGLLDRIGITAGGGFHKRVLDRVAAAGREDMHILHAIARRIAERLK